MSSSRPERWTSRGFSKRKHESCFKQASEFLFKYLFLRRTSFHASVTSDIKEFCHKIFLGDNGNVMETKMWWTTEFLIHKLKEASVSNHPWSMWNMMMRIGVIVFRMTFWIYRFDSWRFLVFFVNTSGFSVVRACLVQIGRSVNSICIVITIRTLHLDSIFFQRKKLFKYTALLTFKLVQRHMVLYYEKLNFQQNRVRLF